MGTSFSGKYWAQSFYDECNTIQFKFKLKLNYKTDADVIQWLNRQKNSNNSSMQGASQYHHFKWWFKIAPVRGKLPARLKGGIESQSLAASQ